MFEMRVLSNVYNTVAKLRSFGGTKQLVHAIHSLSNSERRLIRALRDDRILK